MQIEEKRQYDRDYYASMSTERKKRKQALMRDRIIRIRDSIRAFKAEIGCASCAERDVACLDFHHTDDNKEINVSDAVRLGWSLERLRTEMAKCVVLCSNCHRKLHFYSMP